MSRSFRPHLIWNDRLDAAVTLAGRVHKAHIRKGTRIAYIAHLFDVASIATKHGADEDEVAAAFLHDTLEDCKLPETPEALRREIRKRLGARVLEIVEACTDTTEKPKPPWRARKKAYVAGIAKKTLSAKIVSASDKIANLGDMIEDYRRDGDALWKRFSGERDDILRYYRACARGFVKGKMDSRLRRLVAELTARTGKLARMSGRRGTSARPRREISRRLSAARSRGASRRSLPAASRRAGRAPSAGSSLP
jgi:5'-deoxynucleotidase YfbR-like HD superfamily hydrolase